MDPYLEDEKRWPEFQHHFVTSLYQILLPGLVDRYRARVGQRQYETLQPLFTSLVREKHTEEYIEIRQRSDARLVTFIDVVSLANKTIQTSRQAYLDKRRESKSAAANLVEIDLIMQGQATLDYSRVGLPDADHVVTVTRPTQPERYEVYTATLQKRLPRFRLPLAADDHDTHLDLQVAFTRAFDLGSFASKINYQRDPATYLTQEDRKWIHELLKLQKLRK